MVEAVCGRTKRVPAGLQHRVPSAAHRRATTGIAWQNLDQHSLGVIVRSDGIRQVTYTRQVAYLDGNELLNVTGSTITFSGSGGGAKPSVHPAGTFSLSFPEL
jgi:hypothetical protein